MILRVAERVTKNYSALVQTDKMCTGWRTFRRTKTKKIPLLSFRVKKSKNLKKPQFTYEIFFDLAPIPADTSTEILPIVVLHSAAVEKKTKIKHPDLENGPSKSLFVSPI